MGNTPQPNHFDIDIHTQFQQIDQLPTGIILQHKQNKQTYLLKQYTYGSEMQYQQERARLEREIACPRSENILGVYRIKTHTISGLCSTTHKIYAIYEYPQVSLQDQIIARRKENKQFDQNELWSVLQSCNTALSMLKSSISLKPNYIFITPQGQMKVISNDMISEQYRYTLDKSYYYAPQKITNFCKLDNEITISKQAVFSMGMTLLQTALLSNKLQCYDFDQMVFLEDELSCCLEQLEGQYSADLVQILDLMLNVNANVRPSVGELQKMLDNYWNNSLQNEEKQQAKNGESLNIQVYDQQKRFLMTSQDGVFKHLATVTSNQKESIIRSDFHLNNTPHTKTNKAESLDRLTGIQKKEEKTKIRQSASSHQKQNIYTDPRLLQMIKRDLECINQLKQSTLKQTIKHSFLYPSHSIFQSVKDLDQTSKHQQTTNTKYLNLPSSSNRRPLQQSNHKNNMQMSVQNSAFNAEYKLVMPAEFSKRSYMKSSNIQKLVYCREVDGQGKQYEGYKYKGQKQGRGRLTFEDGVYYQGEFHSDHMNGRGILYYHQNKPAYDGMWVNNQFHGLGTLYNENPQPLQHHFNFQDFDQVEDYWHKYQGQFYFDNKCGRGKLYLTNGQTLQGCFQNDMINGQCQFKSLQGETVRGVWQQNRLVELHQ